MEAGDCATRDGDKQQREDAGGAVRDGLAKRGCRNFRANHQEGAVEDDQANEELQAVDVVARLQQYPHGQKRGDECVGEQEDDPPAASRDTQHFLRQGERHAVTQDHQAVERGNAHDGYQRQVPLEAVDGLADQQRHHDRTPGWDNGGRGGDQQVRNHHGERGIHHEQQQEDDNQEQVAAARADVAAGQGADGLAAVALGGPQRPQIMHPRKEHRAKGHPQKRRHPAPNHGNGWADNRRRTRNGGEVVAPQHVFVGGHEVHAVFHGVGGRFVCV